MRDCLRRTLVSVEAEERFPERLKETSMNDFFSDESASMLSLMENFPERYKTQCFPESKTLFSYMTEGISHFRLLLSPVIQLENGLNKGGKAFNKCHHNKVR